METTATSPKDAILAWAQEYKATMKAEFVPFSKSRNANEKYPSLNWRVTIQRDGRNVLTTDYGAGCGYCEAYKASIRYLGNKNCIMRDDAIRAECETGRKWNSPEKHATPDFADVLHSLSLDASALDYTFEGWSADLGYDSDSRKAEAIYRACVDIAIRLRQAFGNDALEALREAGQDY